MFGRASHLKPPQGKDTAKGLLTLWQGSQSVAEMAVDFHTLTTESGWNNEALQGAFPNALSIVINETGLAVAQDGCLDSSSSTHRLQFCLLRPFE